MRTVLQTLLIFTTLGATSASRSLMARDSATPVVLDTAWIRVVPTAWFVDARLTKSLRARLGCLGVVVLSGLAHWRLDPAVLYRRLSKQLPCGASPLVLRFLKRL